MDGSSNPYIIRETCTGIREIALARAFAYASRYVESDAYCTYAVHVPEVAVPYVRRTLPGLAIHLLPFTPHLRILIGRVFIGRARAHCRVGRAHARARARAGT